MQPFEKLFKIMTKPVVATSSVILLICLFYYVDQPVANYFNQLNLKISVPILSWIIKVGVAPLQLAVIFALALFFRYVAPNELREARCWFLWLCVFIPNLICLILKVNLGRARPELLFADQLYGFYGFHKDSAFWSFPSGHTSTIMGLIWGLSILFPRYFYSLLGLGLSLVALRVLLCDHYLTDVLATSYLALVEIGLLFMILKRKSGLITRAHIATCGRARA